MDIEKHLIFIKNQDKTDQLKHCQYLDGKWKVTYNNSPKVYTYNEIDVVWYKNPAIINPQIYILYYHNEPISGAMKIMGFTDYIRVIFKNGYKKLYNKASIVMEKTALSSKAATNCFAYLKKVADQVGIQGEGGSNFLSNQYEKINKISPRSVLATYLQRKPLAKQADTPVQPIFPFGFNLSQKAGTQKALTNQLTIIEGPPGTGKTPWT